MNTIFKHKILAGAAFLAMLFAGTSCEDKIGPQVTPEAPNADKTLYEVLIADKELTDFVDILRACNLPGGADVADSLFNKSRVYTLWAPKNGAFDKQSLINRINAGYRDDVMKTFVESHVANHLHAAKGVFEENNFVSMINEKMVIFEGSYKQAEDGFSGYKFAGQKISKANIKVWNGMLHKLENAAQYKYNIWEYLKMDKSQLGGLQIDSFANFLYSYDDTRFDEYSSIAGPMVDGVQTYLDSVFVTSNKLLSVYNGIGPVNAEDSLYTIYVPTNDVWNNFMKQAKKHFNYNVNNLPPSLKANVRYIDSLRHFYPRYNLIKYLTFSEYEKKYVKNDSLLPANRDKSERPKFEPGLFDGKVVYNKELSNGNFNIIDKFPYNMYELWHDTIKVEGENAEMRPTENSVGVAEHLQYFVSKGNIRDIYKNGGHAEISGGSYYEARSNGNEITISYKLPNVRSASYKIGIITVPKDIMVEYNEELLPAKLYVTLNQNDERQYIISGIETNPNRLDTLFLPVSKDDFTPKAITFPYCEYYNTHKNTDFTTTLSIRSAGNKNYDKSLRIDAILLIPVDDAE